jgi:hypothetical protein
MPTLTNTKSTKSHFALASNDVAINSAKNALQANGFNVQVVNDLKEAHDIVIKLIPNNTMVFTATSVTLEKSGLAEELNSDKYQSIRNQFMALYGEKNKQLEMRKIGSVSEYAVGSVHAITQDGHILIASATGSQIPNYAYGANNIVWVAGSQKIVKDLNEAIDRIENYTFHLENERAKKAYGSESSLNKILIYRKDPTNHATIVIVKEAVGF